MRLNREARASLNVSKEDREDRSNAPPDTPRPGRSEPLRLRIRGAEGPLESHPYDDGNYLSEGLNSGEFAVLLNYAGF